MYKSELICTLLFKLKDQELNSNKILNDIIGSFELFFIINKFEFKNVLLWNGWYDYTVKY